MTNLNLMTGPAGRGTFVKLLYPDGQATFTMGSNRWDNSQPVREVTLTKPIAPQETQVTVDEYRDHIEICNNMGITHGRFIYGPDWRIANILCADSENAVRKMGVELQAGLPLTRVSPIWQLVPTMKQFEARFSHLENGGAEFLKGDHPVVNVYWPEAAACASLYYGGRLLTEAEWEYFARAGMTGDDIAGTDTGEVTTQNAHFRHEGSVRSTVPVKSHVPNRFGIYGMAGNAYDWVQDGWTDSYKGLPVVDPVGSLTSSFRVARGGSWGSGEGRLRAAYRSTPSWSFASSISGSAWACPRTPDVM